MSDARDSRGSVRENLRAGLGVRTKARATDEASTDGQIERGIRGIIKG